MSSLAARNIGRLLPRLVRAAERQRHLSSLAPISVTRNTHQLQQTLRAASLGPGYSSSATEQQLVEDGWKKSTFTSNEAEMVDRLLYSLDLAIRRTGRVTRHELDKIFNLIEKTGVCTPSQALLVIKCCGNVLVDLDRKTRSKIAEKCFNMLKSLSNTPLDISHYNALLKVHTENSHPINVSEFLAMLEELNIPANRVTFQSCVALFCDQGDISGATAILQHMKANNLAINEAVFHSLLAAHAVNHDPDSVASTIEVMKNSGIPIGAEAYTVIAHSYGRSGQWHMVQDTLEKVEMAEKVKLSDSDILTIMLGCTEGGLLEDSLSLIPQLPMNRGYFQEVRNSVPQLALMGNIDAAVSLYTNLKNRDNFDKEGQGMFLVSSVARSDAEIEKIFEAVLKLEENGFVTARQYLVEEASYNWSKEKILKLKEIFANSDKKLQIDDDLLYKFLRSYIKHENDMERILLALKNMRELGVKIPEPLLANDVIPAMYKPDVLPRDLLKKINQALPNFSFDYLANAMTIYLLNSGSQEHFDECKAFFLYIPFFTKPDKWNSSLARAYLNTKDVDTTVTIMTLTALRMGPNDKMKTERFFRVLNYIGKQAHIIQPGVPEEELIAPIIRGLIDNKIGIPLNLFQAQGLEQLNGYMKSEDSKKLLEEARGVWEETASKWTFENSLEKCKQMKEEWFSSQKRKNGDRKSPSRRYDIKSLNSKEELEEIQEMLIKSSKIDAGITGKLVDLHLREKNLVKAMELYESNENFHFTQQSLENVVDLLLAENRPYDALNLVKKDVVEANRKMFYSCLMKLLTGLIEVGDHKAVMETLEIVPKSSLIQPGLMTNKLLGAYADRGNVEQLNEVNLYLVTNDLVQSEKLDNLLALVDVYLAKDDLSGALLEIKRIAKVNKKMPRKFQLTCRLIEENNSVAVEELLDASTELYGEETSIYDLAHCFLALGKKDQAKNLLETPGLRCDNMKLVYIFDQLVAKNQTAYAEALIGITRRMHGGDRNMLYIKLVNLFSGDPDKVEDIWLQIQEEGFVPNNNLLLEMSNCLKKHGRIVPFTEPTEEDLPAHDVVPDKMVLGAIRKKNIKEIENLVMRSFDDGNFITTLKCKRNAIDFLINNRKFKEAANIAEKLAKNFENPKKIQFKEFYTQIIAGLGNERGLKFYNELPEGLRNMLDFNPETPEESSAKQKQSTSDDKSSNTDLMGTLKLLLSENKTDEAAKFILDIPAVKEDNRKRLAKIKNFVQNVCELFKHFESNGEVEKMRAFLDKLGPNASRHLRANVWYKTILIKTHQEGFLSLLKVEPEKAVTDFFIRNTDVLTEVTSKNPTFVEKLETLSNENNTAATMLLAKLHLNEQNQEQFLKKYEKCTGLVSSPKLLLKIFDKIDSFEKLEMALNVVDSNHPELVRHLFGNSLFYMKESKHVDKIKSMAETRGVNLEKEKQQNKEGVQ